MSNFAFLPETFQAIAEAAHAAEGHIHGDPRAACHDHDEDAPSLADTLAAPSGFGPVRRIENRQQAEQLLAAVQALPDDQREAFLLQAEGGMSVQDIAAATGVPFETAKSRLRYARAALRRTLETLA